MSNSKNSFIRKKVARDIEKVYPKTMFIKKLLRFMDALKNNRNFSIQIAGEKISVPKDAIFNIEHEREKNCEEIEFQIKWKK